MAEVPPRLQRDLKAGVARYDGNGRMLFPPMLAEVQLIRLRRLLFCAVGERRLINRGGSRERDILLPCHPIYLSAGQDKAIRAKFNILQS